MEILADLGDLTLARATRDHIPVIERLLADDPTSPRHVATTTLISDELLGETPESADLETAFARIDSDPHQTLAVILDDTDHVIGTLQLTLIPTMARGGGIRALVTGLRVRSGPDSVQVARRAFEWAIGRARSLGARVLVVVTDRQRAHIPGFYTPMGFRASHDGLTLPL